MASSQPHHHIQSSSTSEAHPEEGLESHSDDLVTTPQPGGNNPVVSGSTGQRGPLGQSHPGIPGLPPLHPAPHLPGSTGGHPLSGGSTHNTQTQQNTGSQNQQQQQGSSGLTSPHAGTPTTSTPGEGATATPLTPTHPQRFPDPRQPYNSEQMAAVLPFVDTFNAIHNLQNFYY